MSAPKLHFEISGGLWLDVEVDPNEHTVSVSGPLADGEDETIATFSNWKDLCSAWPKTWRDLLERFAESDGDGDGDGDGEDEDEGDGDGEHPVPDLDRALALAVRRARRKAPEAWNETMERARGVIRKAKLPKGLANTLPKHLRRDVDLSPKTLADSLTYVIEVLHHDEPAKLGQSKYGGPAHVPKGFIWPTVDGKPTALLVQINLEELAAADPSKSVPAKGMFYWFVNEVGHGCVRHSDGKALEIRRNKTPELLEDLDDEERLTFNPAFYFAQGTDTGLPGAIAEAIPEALRKEIAAVLGTSSDPCDAFPGDRVFGGDPVDWQAMGESYVKHELFMQMRFSDGNVAVGVHPIDLLDAEFDDVDCGYCGT